MARKTKSSRTRVRRLAGLAVMVVGAAVAAFVWLQVAPIERRYEREGERLNAEVIDRFTQREEREDGTFTGAALEYLTVRFRLDGERIDFTDRVREDFFAGTQVGEIVVVEYIPGEPEMRRIRDGSPALVRTAYVIAGCLMLGGLFLVLFARRSRVRGQRRFISG